MKRFNYENYAYNLPDRYAKGADSNNYKILLCENIAVNGLEADIEAVSLALDIERAKGETLDLYGEMFNQPRGVANDEQYRLLIKSKLLQNVSTGDYKSVVSAICGTLLCDPSEVLIVEGKTPCSVEIVMLPLEIINKAGLTVNQTLAMIQRLLPACVSIDSYLFEGTFTFSNSENEASDTEGFADETQAIGGYLGAVTGEENENILPI